MPAEPVPPPVPSDPSEVVRVARVLETMDSGGYTFARMDACGQEAWVAGPPVDTWVGQTLELVGGAGMADFHSPTLGRTFDQILFVDRWRPAEKEMVCGGAPPVAANPSALEVPDDVRIGKVGEVLNASGYVYVKLDVCGTETWIAAPEVRVEVGSLAASPLGMEMRDYQSVALERTFPSVWFVPWVKRSRVPADCP